MGRCTHCLPIITSAKSKCLSAHMHEENGHKDRYAEKLNPSLMTKIRSNLANAHQMVELALGPESQVFILPHGAHTFISGIVSVSFLFVFERQVVNLRRINRVSHSLQSERPPQNFFPLSFQILLPSARPFTSKFPRRSSMDRVAIIRVCMAL